MPDFTEEEIKEAEETIGREMGYGLNKTRGSLYVLPGWMSLGVPEVKLFKALTEARARLTRAEGELKLRVDSAQEFREHLTECNAEKFRLNSELARLTAEVERIREKAKNIIKQAEVFANDDGTEDAVWYAGFGQAAENILAALTRKE